MIEEIYVMIIAFFPQSHYDFIDPMIPYLTDANIDEAKIVSCRRIDFPQAVHCLRILESLNGATSIGDLLAKEEGVLRLRIRADKPIRYQPLPWLNAVLKDYLFTPPRNGTGAYYFYLTKNEEGTLRFECPAQLVVDETEMDESDNDDDDDFTFIQDLAPYFDRLFYGGDADELYPDITAKLLLQFGE